MRSDLESKVSKDDRSRLITASMNEKLRKKYSIKRDDKLFAVVSLKSHWAQAEAVELNLIEHDGGNTLPL